MRFCVFLGSSRGRSDSYRQIAVALGDALVAARIGLVYGGASIGLMGELANTVLGQGGEVIGVIPQALSGREGARTDLNKLHVVNSMHDRKLLMAELSDAFVVLPGGIGTMEEFFEVWSWSQLGIRRKPCGLLNVGGYYDKLISFVERMEEEQFIKPSDRRLVTWEDDACTLVRSLLMQASKMPPYGENIKLT